jgi:hypothetical protein
MKFVILSHKIIPGYGVKGPILSPANYDVHLVLKWIAAGLDVREVMEDGSYRKLSFNDKKLLEILNDKLKKQAEKREAVKRELEEVKSEPIKPMGGVKLVPEDKPLPVAKPKKKKVEKVVEKPKKEEQPKEEPSVELFIDELEKPE